MVDIAYSACSHEKYGSIVMKRFRISYMKMKCSWMNEWKKKQHHIIYQLYAIVTIIIRLLLNNKLFALFVLNSKWIRQTFVVSLFSRIPHFICLEPSFVCIT